MRRRRTPYTIRRYLTAINSSPPQTDHTPSPFLSVETASKEVIRATATRASVHKNVQNSEGLCLHKDRKLKEQTAAADIVQLPSGTSSVPHDVSVGD